MEHHSLQPEALRRFLLGTASPQEKREIARHLLAGCQPCRQFLRRSLAPLPATVPLIGVSYDSVFERVEGAIARISEETDEVSRLLFDISAHPGPRQALMVGHQARFWTTPFCDLVLDRSQQARFSDPAVMKHFAHLATLVAGKLDRKQGNESQIREYRVRSWSILANALRVSGDLNSADRALLQARQHLGKDRDALGLKADLLSHLSSLRFDQRRFQESLASSREDISIRRDLHLPVKVAQALVSQAMSLGEAGFPLQALEVLAEAEPLAKTARDIRLSFIIQHNRVRFTLLSGELPEAQRLHRAMEPLHQQISDPLIQVRTVWLGAEILSAADQRHESLDLLQSVRGRFLDYGNTYEAAYPGLEAADLLIKLGRKNEARRLAAAALREFGARGIQRDYLAALILLRQAS
jgi:hypothetical protein